VDVLVNVYCTLTEVFLNLTEDLLTLTEVFPCFFLSCKANTRVKLAKTGHGPHYSTLVVICAVRLLFVLFFLLFVLYYVLFVCKCVLPPGDNQLQLINISIFLFMSTKIYRTYENWLTAEVTDLEHDSFICHVQFILVVILMPENIRKKTDKSLCLSTSFIISHHV